MPAPMPINASPPAAGHHHAHHHHYGSSSSPYSPRQSSPSSASLYSPSSFGRQSVEAPPSYASRAVATIANPSSPVRRKPLPENASPILSATPRPPGTVSSASLDANSLSRSPAVPNPRQAYPSPRLFRKESAPSAQNRYSNRRRPTLPYPIVTSRSVPTDISEDVEYRAQFANGTPVHSRLTSEPFIPVLNSPPAKHKRTKTNIMALRPSAQRPPSLQLGPNERSMSSGSIEAKNPKTPGNKITSFFGWKSNHSPSAESSSTEISDDGRRSPLPVASMPPSLPPLGPAAAASAAAAQGPFPGSVDFSRSAATNFPPYAGPSSPFPATRNASLSSGPMADPGLSSKIKEMENELREISSELAGSIRREMELEDLVERLQSEIPLDANNRRTSDYFSDSGAGSVRYGPDSANRIDDIEKIKRATEQERAQLKVELSQKWQDERARRAASESHVQILEDQVQQLRRERVLASDLAQKNRELELTLEETRRKLAEERQIKDNFEDLLTAMRVELEQLRNERDHLRDEVVPQMQGQLRSAGPPPVAAPAAAASRQAEIDKLLAEIEALKFENASLAQSQLNNRFASIAEEDGPVPQRSSRAFGLSRSTSLAHRPGRMGGGAGGGGGTGGSGLSRSSSLSRSNSLSSKSRETPDSLADRVKDVEAQRDALHQALKSLLDRQTYQTRENEKRVRMLEVELERALSCDSPRRLGYEKDVRNLREEINILRQRAEDALDQKWQCEKGLAGLKMDLDRAEQETTSLRVLLQEHDIAIPAGIDGQEDGEDEYGNSNSNSSGNGNINAAQATSSSSLEAAYHQLQADREYAEATLLSPPPTTTANQLSGQLAASVSRTDVLADEVRRQLERNKTLRQRLAEAIDRGEREQQVSAARINDLQSRLKELEETVLSAQQHSEEEMAKHEDEILSLKESYHTQLIRMKNGFRSSGSAGLSPRQPLSPFGARSPRLDLTTSGQGIPLTGAVQTEVLEKRVKELERALREADMEMEKVVGRMNRAQIDVAELQADRDESLRQTRKLQAEIQAEREAFRSLRM